MKVVKPSLVSFNCRVLLLAGRQELVVTSLVAFRLGASVRHLVSDIALWPVVGEALPDVVLDEGLPKPGAEVLVHGACHAPRGGSVPNLGVRLAVGPRGSTTVDGQALIDKRLAVFGDRYWIARGAGSGHEMTQAAPFSRMPISWERAFGGEAFAQNPKGRGIAAVAAPDGQLRIPLPNVEYVTRLVARPSQRPEPASFGPIDVAWPQRRSKAGSYDAAWLEDGYPGYARDTDPSFFFTAPADQRTDRPFRGDEEYLLENQHPVNPILRGALPAVSARTFVQRLGRESVEEVRTRLDTVVFLPEQELGVLVFRGATPVVEDDAADVGTVLAALEETADPRPAEHYAAALRRRLDKRQSPILAIREDDIVPVFARRMGIVEALNAEPTPAEEAARKKALARTRKRLVAAGLDPAEVDVELSRSSAPALPDLGDPAVLDALEEKHAAEQAASIEERVDDLQPGSLDPPLAARAQRDAGDALPAAREPAGKGGPPAPEAPSVLAAMSESGIPADEATVEALRWSDAAALDGYRASAHDRPAATPLDEALRLELRARVLHLQGLGESLAELDLTCCDLSDLDLRRADLRRALLEGALFARTRATEADLTGAVLARARFVDVAFEGATLRGANLGAVTMDGAEFAGANLEGANLTRAKLRSVSFRRARLDRVDWSDAEFVGVDFDGADVRGMTFLKPVDLSGCRFPRARLAKANFLETRLRGVDFTEADLELVTLLAVDATGACFRGASLRQLHAVERTSFEGADFEGADLTGAFLRGSNLRGANFHAARLEGTDLSECDLTGATLTQAQAKSVLLVRADLTGARLRGANLLDAMLQKARLHGADLSETNLFAANLGLVRGDTSTQFTGSNLKRALQIPRAKRQPQG